MKRSKQDSGVRATRATPRAAASEGTSVLRGVRTGGSKFWGVRTGGSKGLGFHFLSKLCRLDGE